MTNIRSRICKSCGKTFQGGPRAWHCPECRYKRERERAAKYRREGHKRPLGSTDKCARCGKEYIVTGGLQKYCKECSRDAVMEIDREHGKEWYHRNAEAYNPIRNEKRRVKSKKCIVCGKEFSCNGKPEKMCSEECRKKRNKELQRKKDANRNMTAKKLL